MRGRTEVPKANARILGFSDVAVLSQSAGQSCSGGEEKVNSPTFCLPLPWRIPEEPLRPLGVLSDSASPLNLPNF